MSVEEQPERITLALVAERIEGLKQLSRAEFGHIREQMGVVVGLPVVVTKLEGEVEALTTRVETLEDKDKRGVEWRRGSLPMMVAAGVAAAAALVSAIPHL
jgi:hypothetical protein